MLNVVVNNKTAGSSKSNQSEHPKKKVQRVIKIGSSNSSTAKSRKKKRQTDKKAESQNSSPAQHLKKKKEFYDTDATVSLSASALKKLNPKVLPKPHL